MLPWNNPFIATVKSDYPAFNFLLTYSSDHDDKIYGLVCVWSVNY